MCTLLAGGPGGESAGAGGDGRAPPTTGAAGGRRRRAPRKESRLRESRSLNRIAEVTHNVTVTLAITHFYKIFQIDCFFLMVINRDS